MSAVGTSDPQIIFFESLTLPSCSPPVCFAPNQIASRCFVAKPLQSPPAYKICGFRSPHATEPSHALCQSCILFCPDRRGQAAEEEPMAEAAVDACEIARLPEEIVSATLARAGPREACRAAVVSPAFRAAADSDAVWACFLTRDLPPIADGELPAAPPLSKKELFLRLSNSPVLLPDRLVSLWLDKETGAKCYMLSARQLYIVWSDTPRYWTWIPLTDSRFSEGAQLLDVCWLEIRGKIQSKMLSENSTYAAYLVYKIDTEFYGLDSPVQEASVSIEETKLTRRVCLQDYDDEDREIPENYRLMRPSVRFMTRRRNRRVVPPGENAQLPHKRTNGWMELELGEFFNEGGEDGEVSVDLTETKGGNWKKGLIVQGVEIRVKKSG